MVRILSRLNQYHRHINAWPNWFENHSCSLWGLILGKKPDAATIANITAANSEIGLDIPAVATHGSVLAAEGTSYKLIDIKFTMFRYDLPKTFADAMIAVLASDSVYQYWYPSYT